MTLHNFDDLFVHELRDLHDAENEIYEALQKLRDAASNKELKQIFSDHLRQTDQHINRLEYIANELHIEVDGEQCEGIRGIIKEVEKVLREKSTAELKDAALISMAKRVEHYEIAGYRSAVTYAELLHNEQALDLLSRTLQEEEDIDAYISHIGRTKIYEKALHPHINPQAYIH